MSIREGRVYEISRYSKNRKAQGKRALVISAGQNYIDVEVLDEPPWKCSMSRRGRRECIAGT